MLDNKEFVDALNREANARGFDLSGTKPIIATTTIKKVKTTIVQNETSTTPGILSILSEMWIWIIVVVFILVAVVLFVKFKSSNKTEDTNLEQLKENKIQESP